MHTCFKKVAQESSLPSSSKSEISINEFCRVLYHVLLFSDTLPNFPGFATGLDEPLICSFSLSYRDLFCIVN